MDGSRSNGSALPNFSPRLTLEFWPVSKLLWPGISIWSDYPRAFVCAMEWETIFSHVILESWPISFHSTRLSLSFFFMSSVENGKRTALLGITKPMAMKAWAKKTITPGKYLIIEIMLQHFLCALQRSRLMPPLGRALYNFLSNMKEDALPWLWGSPTRSHTNFGPKIFFSFFSAQPVKFWPRSTRGRKFKVGILSSN